MRPPSKSATKLLYTLGFVTLFVWLVRLPDAERSGKGLYFGIVGWANVMYLLVIQFIDGGWWRLPKPGPGQKSNLRRWIFAELTGRRFPKAGELPDATPPKNSGSSN
jgi:hypothetical protein